MKNNETLKARKIVLSKNKDINKLECVYISLYFDC